MLEFSSDVPLWRIALGRSEPPSKRSITMIKRLSVSFSGPARLAALSPHDPKGLRSAVQTASELLGAALGPEMVPSTSPLRKELDGGMVLLTQLREAFDHADRIAVFVEVERLTHYRIKAQFFPAGHNTTPVAELAMNFDRYSGEVFQTNWSSTFDKAAA